jgi:putative phosphoribosyl transferase
MDKAQSQPAEREVCVTTVGVELHGSLAVPDTAHGVVLFAHGSGSSRLSPRNQYVARVLRQAGFATLLLDLLTTDEESVDQYTRHLRFDIELLALRLIGATDWLGQYPPTRDLAVGYFGASTGSGAALLAAAERSDVVRAVVSRGGRPDQAGPTLLRVHAPTLLIVGGADAPVIDLNERAMELLAGEKELRIVPEATHLFEEPGALEEAARLAADWFVRHLVPAHAGGIRP